MRERPIGLLDSGVGGLTVLKAVKDRLPNESFIYIGDTKRCPYGNRSADEITTYTLELVQFLMDQDVKMIVIACNTATAHALETVRKKVDIPVIGVIEPGSKAAAQTTTKGEIGVLATVGTVDSGFYDRSIMKHNSSVQIKSLPCPEFVEIVEQNKYESEEAERLVQRKLETFKTEKMDTLILGCTHFPLLAPFIQKEMGEAVTLIDSGVFTSYKVEQVLAEQGNETSSHTNGTLKLFTTGVAEQFRTIAQNWLQTNDFSVESVSLERLGNIHDTK